jgi:O-acetylhomoserine (thiol)-lyase
MAQDRPRGFTTDILHSDRLRGAIEHGALHKPVHSSVAYGFEDAQMLAAVFQGTEKGFSYSRSGNPTVEALEAKITAMEEGVGTVAFSTGMAAIGSILFSLLRAGDHFLSSAFLFGNTNSLFQSFAAQGIDVSFADATSLDAMKAALRPETRMVFVETIANPRTQIADLEALGALCAERGIVFVVDNTMTSPWLFQPKAVGAHLVVNALTKYIGGHGAALGGAVTDTGLFPWDRYPHIFDAYRSAPPARQALTQLRKKGLRDFGASLAPEAAHTLALGAETLALRLDRACANAAALASFLEAHPKVQRVYHPSLKSHAQHDRAARLFRHPGALLSFELDPREDLFAFCDRLQLAVNSTNLGDNRTLIIPVAHTIYFEMGAARRAEMGLAEGLLRVSVGIEDSEDLLADFAASLGALKF